MTSIFDLKNIVKSPPKASNLSPLEKRQIRNKNLTDLSRILEKYNIKWFVWWGTMLGAVRGQNFIDHDTDDDIGVYFEDKHKFDMSTVFKELTESDFTVFRVYNNGRSFSISRNQLYIDIQTFEKVHDRAVLYGSMSFPAECFWPPHLLETVILNGSSVPIPRFRCELLTGMYGKNWKVPQKRGNNHYPILFFKMLLPQETNGSKYVPFCQCAQCNGKK